MENSEVPENSEQLPKKSEQIPEKRITESEPKKDEPEKVEKRLTQVEEATAAPKSRGRPKNSRDTKPRIKRIPIAAPEDEQPKLKVVKKVVVLEEPEEEEEQEEQEEVAAPLPSMVEPESKIPVPKSPRTLRREHMQSVATQKRAMTQARQDRFERVLDGFMGF